ncbi:MAG TPA: amidohydrolase family protein [Patescibacteria group bacterium]|nr:amidohydrolase family protein [Patescibacteria group bacterium]
MMYDVVIKNGILIDPERLTRSVGNLAIRAGTIAAVTTEDVQGLTEIDAAGKMVAPGFIDIHGHVELDAYCGELCLRQGITTTVGGNCGFSPPDIEAFFHTHETEGFILNQAEFIGHSMTLRQAVGITDPRMAATKEQMKQMEELAERAFIAGACGLSLGWGYAPGSSIEEVIQLSRLAARYGRVVAVDTRMHTAKDLYSLVEVLDIARKTSARIQVSHLVYQYGTGVMDEALAIINRARAEGLDIRFDSGMYTDWATYIGAVLFSEEALAANGYPLDKMMVLTGRYKGQRLNQEILRELRADDPHTSVAVFTGIEEEIYMALAHPFAMPSTDTGAYAPGEGHPQIAGSFPRYFRKMVIERYELSIMEAVRKATLLPAETLGFHQKGRLRTGMDADVVVFDMKRLQDRADFGNPDAWPEGVAYVLVNGQLALEGESLRNRRAGKAVRCTLPIYEYHI